MAEMSKAEIITTWKEGVSLMEQGYFQDALIKFIALEGRTDCSQQLITSGRNLFNIGQTYLALGEFEEAAKSFEEAVDKDKMLAVGHYILGIVNLVLNRNEKALQNFNDAYFYLRGNNLINYQPLGLKHRLYLCEILTNRAIAHSRLGDFQEAREDFLMAQQCTVEPRYNIIEDCLQCWQAGQNVDPLTVPSQAVFKPDEKLFAAIQQDFSLEKSQVIAVLEVARFPDSRTKPQPPSLTNSTDAEDDQFHDQEHTPTTKEEGISNPLDPPNRPLPGLPGRPNSPRRPPPSPRSRSPMIMAPPPSSGAESPSPLPRKRNTSTPVGPLTTLLPNDEPTRSKSVFEIKPPEKPLPPTPKAKSPIPSRKISAPAQLDQSRDVTVTVQLILTRSIKVDKAASTQDLVRAAANTFNLPEDSFALWCTKNGQLSALQDKDLVGILSSPAENKGTFYCYESKPE